jgi:hypothetical protein
MAAAAKYISNGSRPWIPCISNPQETIENWPNPQIMANYFSPLSGHHEISWNDVFFVLNKNLPTYRIGGIMREASTK